MTIRIRVDPVVSFAATIGPMLYGQPACVQRSLHRWGIEPSGCDSIRSPVYCMISAARVSIVRFSVGFGLGPRNEAFRPGRENGEPSIQTRSMDERPRPFWFGIGRLLKQTESG